MASTLALEMRGVEIAFSGVPVLKDTAFDLRSGEVHGIVGTNGAGKSTLMKIITGVNQPDAGTIKVFGKVITPHFSPQEAFQHGIAMVYQDLSLVESLTVTQNIFLSFQPFKGLVLIDEKKETKRASELLSMLGVSTINPSAMIADLSVGQAQIVEIAKTLSWNPKILILDEPTASLSQVEIDVLFRAVKKLREKGLSIIYITHYLEDTLRICDRITVLRDGRSIFTKETTQVSISDMVKGMLGKEEKSQRIWNQNVSMTDKEPLLRLEKISTHKIHDISLMVYPGEVVGLAGLLGSGRTEILRAIYGIDPLQRGDIFFHGRQLIIRSPHDAIIQGISLVPEERRREGLILDFNICYNTTLSILKKLRRWGLLDFTTEYKITDEAIKNLQVQANNRFQVVRFLSGGNQQKIVIAKFLATDSELLLLDDPTFGIDVHSKREIMSIISDYAAKGNGVIFVSSEFKEIVSFCNRTYIVKKGRIVNEYANRNLSENRLLEAV